MPDPTLYLLGSLGAEQPMSANDASISSYVEMIRKDTRLAAGNMVSYKVAQKGHWQWRYAYLPGLRAYVYDGGMSYNDLFALMQADVTMSFLVPADNAPQAAYTVRFALGSWRQRLVKRAGDFFAYEVSFELLEI